MVFKEMAIHSVLPTLAAVKEMGARFPNWNKVMNLANQCQYAQAGMALLTDSFGNQHVIPQAQLSQPVDQPALPPAAHVAETTESIQAVKAEINKTQGRALSAVESGIRADMQAGFDEIKLLLTPPASAPEK